MRLTQHQTISGARWALNGNLLPPTFRLDWLLQLPADALMRTLATQPANGLANGSLLAPIEDEQEVWASGVTYLRSRDARVAESQSSDVYEKVYRADRPELFFKSAGWRSAGPGQPIRVRGDSIWNVPEPEVTLVINRFGEIVGYCAGNDVSSRSIEAENPLYLPQAKIYNGSLALGSGIHLCAPDALRDLPVTLEIERDSRLVFSGTTSTANMKRPFIELVACLFRELDFPRGVFLLTGTGIVPPDSFSLRDGDVVRIQTGEEHLENRVQNG